MEILETHILRKVASTLDESWLELAPYLGFDVDECEQIQDKLEEPIAQAEEMLVLWRDQFPGDNPVEYLARALITIEQRKLARELGRPIIFVDF